MTKIFISHASEDKDAVARPLAQALKKLDFDVWFDDYSLLLGDSLRQAIDKGLATCDYGVVVLSPAFFAKRWTNWELDGLVAIEMQLRRTVLLPVWHQVGHEEILRYSPPLANRLAVSTAEGVPAVAHAIAKRVRASEDLSAEPDEAEIPERSVGVIPFKGYWDLEATDCGWFDNRDWRTFSIRGYLDRWEHDSARALMFGHLRTAFPQELHIFRGSSREATIMTSFHQSDQPDVVFPQKSGATGDLLFDMTPAYCVRVQQRYSEDDSDLARIPYSSIGSLTVAGEGARRLELREKDPDRLLIQVIFPSELEPEILDGVLCMRESYPGIEIRDER